MRLLLLAVIALFVFATPSFAQYRRGGCGTCYAPPVVVAKPIIKEVIKEVITPVAVPVFVPTFQFQYAAPCSPVAYGQVGGYPVGGYPAYGTAGYGAGAYGAAGGAIASVQQQVQQQMQPTYGLNGANGDKERLRALAKALLEEMNKEAGSSSGQQDEGPPMAILPGQGQPQPGPQGVPSGQKLNVVQVLQNKCGTCHTGVAHKGRYMLFDQFGQFNQQVDRKAGLDAVEALKMPEGAKTDPSKRLTQQEYEALREWVFGR